MSQSPAFDVNRVLSAGAAAALALFVSAPLAYAAATESVIYGFGSGFVDGQEPVAGLTVSGGLLYGTAPLSGPYGSAVGVVFQLSTTGAESIVYNFNGGSGGSNPAADLTAVSGVFYGTTQYSSGSSACKYGCGTVFKVTPQGSETLLHTFNGSDGAVPLAGLAAIGQTLYGVTSAGGTGACTTGTATGCGTIFHITANGAFTVLHRFAGGKDGSFPAADLLNVGGTLYGATETGGGTGCGGAGCGTIFKITPAGVLTIVHAFAGGADGANPRAGLLLSGTTLYGTTFGGGSSGNGTVFEILAGGTETVLHAFAGGSADGMEPAGALIQVGNLLYGTTAAGGKSNEGTVYSMTLSGTEKLVYAFQGGNDGAEPVSRLANIGGVLYGTTENGGANGFGTAFKITP